tara:strand:+ start:2444 stop:3082 length:639 start_codon:yes stop_codon:yes gene_type:complete
MKITQKIQALNIIEPAYLASLSSLLWIALYYLPIGGALLRLTLPLPVALLQLRRGTKIAINGIVIQIILLIILMGPVRGPLFLFPYGFLSLCLGWFWLNGRNWWYSWSFGSLIGAIGFFIRVIALSILVGENLWVVITRASYGLIDKLLTIMNLSLEPSLISIQLVAILLVAFQEIIYVLTIHIIAYAVFPRLKSHFPEPPQLLYGFVDLNF